MIDDTELFELAEQLDIKVLSFPFEACKSLSLKYNDTDYYIGIDEKSIDTTSEKRVHLAHELGHCATDAFYNEYSPVDYRGKCEMTADKWAVKKLINKAEFEKLLKSGAEVWEIADYFNVTEDFIQMAYHFYFELKIA